MNEQAAYWIGKNGNDYIGRNQDATLLAAYLAMWGRILACIDGITSAIEFGANVGLNLDAISTLVPGISCRAVEPNAEACKVLRAKGYRVDQMTLQEWAPPDAKADLAFTRGVLIHVPPKDLPLAYDWLYQASRRYIVVAEYYNPNPVAIRYRGQDGLLWKRDFAGDMLERFDNLRLVDYGFIYRRDPAHPQDDVTYFLLEKQKS